MSQQCLCLRILFLHTQLDDKHCDASESRANVRISDENKMHRKLSNGNTVLAICFIIVHPCAEIGKQ